MFLSGSNEVAAVFWGTVEVKSIWLGNTLVWQSGPDDIILDKINLGDIFLVDVIFA